MSSNNTGTGTAVQASGSANTAPGAAIRGPTSKAGASISIFGLILLSVTAVISLNNLPSEAEYGLSSVCYFVFAAIFFLIPVSMVAAELATGWPERGVFRWVGEAFKGRFGLMAMFLAFVEVCVFLPTTLTFAAVSIAYVNPDDPAAEALASNKFVIVAIVLIVYWIAAFIVVAIVVSGTLIVAYVVPQKDINLTQAILTTYFDIFHWAGVPWLGPVVAVMLAIGVLVNATTWVVGPSTGLLAAAKAGYLPKPLQRTNKHGPPVTILMIQSGLVTVLRFTAAIRLRYSQPDRPRPFRLGKKGNGLMWLVASVGCLSSLIAYAFSFIPPDQIKVGSPLMYVLILVGLVLVFYAVPNIIHHFREPSWDAHDPDFAPFTWQVSDSKTPAAAAVAPAAADAASPAAPAASKPTM